MLKRLLAAAAAVSLAALSSTAALAQAKDLRWATSSDTSSGYKALVILANVLNKEMPQYQITVLPTPGAVVTIKGYATGKYEGFYGSDVAFAEFAANSGRFKDFRASVTREPMQSFWAFTLEPGISVKASDRDKYKSWGDLAGKKVFTGPLPFDTRNQLERALTALGIKHNYVQVDLATAGSQLESGAIDAMCIYTAAETTPPPWLTQATLATDWAVLNPSAEEIATLKAKGFEIAELAPTAYKKDIHADKAVVLPFFYGFHVGSDVSVDDVYAMLKLIESKAGELAKADNSYQQIADDFVGMQKRGIASSADFVPIHPGLAKYMREKGAWDSKWDSKVGTI